MNLARWMLTAVAALSLAACSSGPVKRINPPSASIQELAVQADGQWNLVVRVQNFSTVPMTFSRIDGNLRIDGVDAAELKLDLDVDVVGERAETVRATIKPTGALAPGGTLSYTLKGRITANAPKSQTFDFDHSSQLSPVPGIDNTWR